MAARGDDAPLAQDDRGQEQSVVHDGAVHPPQHAPLPNYSITRTGSKVFKSGSLFISSKGIGWTSWKKRWFILTSTSLVFFRSDPTAVPQKGSEVNLTLGGIDLNNSGRVVVKADKKLLTVLFPDGCDERTFTLKAETLEDLCDWKDALEKALSQAPGAAIVMGQNEVFGNDHGGTVDGSLDQLKDKQVAKPTVIGRPILLALEDIDGTPSFLEKALQFVEEHGIKVEGILRQAADVDDVEHRIREYEQGNIEFSSAEDAHVVGDCIKYILRELPSSPVPASCCKALLEACRADRHVRVGAMRMAIYETFPEPNRRLLQRILVMMRTIASHKAVNRMSSSAVAACMAPLLLRPLLAGDCDLENEFNMGGDGSIQLMQAAAAANYAQAIVINLLEEYETIFGLKELQNLAAGKVNRGFNNLQGVSMSIIGPWLDSENENAVMPDLYSDTEESGNASEDATDDDDDGSYEDDGDGYYTQDQDSESRSDDSLENEHIESPSGSCETETENKDFSHHSRTDGDDFQNIKRVNERFSLQSRPLEAFVYFEDKQKPSPIVPRSIVTCDVSGSPSTEHNSSNPVNNIQSEYYHRSSLNPDAVGKPVESSQFETTVDKNANKPTTIANKVIHSMRHPAALRHTPAKIYLSTESVDFGSDHVERLEAVKVSLQNKVAEEARENAVLLTDLERKRKALREHRLSLQQDVEKLQEELRKERVLRKALEAALKIPRGPLPKLNIDERVKADLEDLARTEAEVNKLKQKIDGLTKELYKEQEKNRNSHHDSCIEFKQGEEVHETAVNKEADSKSIYGSHVARRSISGKESNRIQTDYEGPQESTSNSNRLSNNLFDSLNYIQPKRSGKPSSSQAPEPHTGKSFPPMSSRRSVSRMQAADMTSTALTKLTSRLNFLKERRSQIANELQNISKSWSSMLATQIPDNGKASGGQSVASRKKKVNLDPGKSNKDV